MDEYLRRVRRDEWGFGVPCRQDGCYEIGLEPDGKCERHSAHRREKRTARQSIDAEPSDRGREPSTE